MLISSSRLHGQPYLGFCGRAIADRLDGRRLLFVPYALADHDRYAGIVRDALRPFGIAVDSLHEQSDQVAALASADAIFVGGGNTFRLLKTVQERGWRETIRARVLKEGAPYFGSSAGTNLACPTIRTTNDMPIVQPESFAALGLIPFQINPHYLDPDPSSTHQGETREQRIAEFHEENEVPVLGLREGSWLAIDDLQMTLEGDRPARLFRAGDTPVECSPGADLSFLLAVQ